MFSNSSVGGVTISEDFQKQNKTFLTKAHFSVQVDVHVLFAVSCQNSHADYGRLQANTNWVEV